MHKGLDFAPLPLEVETSSKNALTVFPNVDFEDVNYQGSPFEDEPLSDGSQYQPCSESWEDFQSLSPFGFDWEMEQEFFRSDVNDVECKKQGPTLAELNNQRSLSPLINPEMERLHRIATKTSDGKKTSASSTIKIRIDELGMTEQSGKQNMQNSVKIEKENFNDDYNNFNVDNVKNKAILSKTDDMSTVTVKQEPNENMELKDSDLMRRIAYLEAKSNSHGSSQVDENVRYSQLGSAKQRSSSSESSFEEEHLAVIHEESADDDSDLDEEDIHVKDNFEVPTKQRKGRRGDGEDMNPNPRKLLEISRELNRLTKIITDLKPIHSLPINARNRSKKEKNKLASRACRLKKKAQHESNKLKLHGLELEHKRLLALIELVKKEIIKDTQGFTVSGELSSKVEKLVHDAVGNQIVAGHTTAFVESVLKATASSTPGFKGVDVHLNI